MDIEKIERLLNQQSLLPAKDVNAFLAELEGAALATVRSSTSAERDRARLWLRALIEYRALRAFAVRNGWHGADDGWPMRSEVSEESVLEPLPAPPMPLGEVADPAVTVVMKPIEERDLVKVSLDDEREAPAGWVRVRNANAGDPLPGNGDG